MGTLALPIRLEHSRKQHHQAGVVRIRVVQQTQDFLRPHNSWRKNLSCRGDYRNFTPQNRFRVRFQRPSIHRRRRTHGLRNSIRTLQPKLLQLNRAHRLLFRRDRSLTVRIHVSRLDHHSSHFRGSLRAWCRLRVHCQLVRLQEPLQC